MDFTKLKEDVYKANMLLPKYNLVIHTWGNVSQKSECGNYYAIKPSGVDYDKLSVDDIVVLDMKGNVIEGKLKPSSDTPTHTVLYNNWKDIKAICHTHSPYCSAWAATGFDIPCYTTTHADNFYGVIPTTPTLSKQQAQGNYEENTAYVILDKFKNDNIDYIATNAVILKDHGPFVWSTKNAKDVADLALTLEEVAKMAYFAKTLNPQQKPVLEYIQDKHYNRKHGKNSYYGQDK